MLATWGQGLAWDLKEARVGCGVRLGREVEARLGWETRLVWQV